MMTRNDSVVMRRVAEILMTHFRFCPPKMMDTVTTRAWEFSQTLNQIILSGWPVRLYRDRIQRIIIRGDNYNEGGMNK